MRKETQILTIDDTIRSLIDFAHDDVTDNKRIGEHCEDSARQRLMIMRIKLLRDGYCAQTVNLVNEVLTSIYFK